MKNRIISTFLISAILACSPARAGHGYNHLLAGVGIMAAATVVAAAVSQPTVTETVVYQTTTPGMSPIVIHQTQPVVVEQPAVVVQPQPVVVARPVYTTTVVSTPPPPPPPPVWHRPPPPPPPRPHRHPHRRPIRVHTRTTFFR